MEQHVFHIIHELIPTPNLTMLELVSAHPDSLKVKRGGHMRNLRHPLRHFIFVYVCGL